MWTREQLKKEAKARILKYYWPAVLIGFIVITFAEGGGSGNSFNFYNKRDDLTLSNYQSAWSDMSIILPTILLFTLGIGLFILVLVFTYKAFVANMLVINEKRFYLCSREYKASIGEIVYAFRNGNYLKSVGTMFFRDLFTFLWSLLFIIPGLVKSYEYRMIPYLLAENSQLDRKRAFQLSKEMMRGQKWDTFVLDLSFILWHLLEIITCIGVYFIRPYIVATQVELYIVLKEISIKNGIASSYELGGFTPNN